MPEDTLKACCTRVQPLFVLLYRTTHAPSTTPCDNACSLNVNDWTIEVKQIQYHAQMFFIRSTIYKTPILSENIIRFWVGLYLAVMSSVVVVLQSSAK